MGGKTARKKAGNESAAVASWSWPLEAWYFAVFATCIILWASHFLYLRHLFENVRFFSHLADFEREMTYRTEMGLYFSYYKTMVNAPTFYAGIQEIMSDNVTEYGHTINTLQRFNLYPEVILAGAFRLFKRVASALEWQTEFCWHVNRADDLPPVQSCEGIGNLHYFYVDGVFGLAGSVLASVFLTGVILSDSYFGGVISATAFVFNHGEATRVAWTPPLRESSAYPVFIAQIALLSYILKTKSTNRIFFVLLTFLTSLFTLFWQLSQFVFATQMGSVFVAFLLDAVSSHLLFWLWKAYATSFLISLVLLFGNPMLMISLFSTSLIAYLVVIVLERRVRATLTSRPLFIGVLANAYLSLVFGGKFILTRFIGIHDDDHVADLLRSKFSDEFATFHTRLYTCAPEFNLIELAWFIKLSKTLLIPTLCTSLILVFVFFSRLQLFSKQFWWRNVDESRKTSVLPSVSAETACFTLMAVLVMRLKLFATPHFCIIASIVASRPILAASVGDRLAKWRLAFVFALLAGMAYEGRRNVEEQLSMRGEYNNPEQERLFDWINAKTSSNAVFAGTMPLMANIKLSTLRPIVNHPHYENEEIRSRTLKVYSMYSRKPLKTVYETLKKMGVEYYIFQQSSCVDDHPDARCTYLAMWDLEDPENRARPPLCRRVMEAIAGRTERISPFFKVVYHSSTYVVLRLIA